MKFNELSILTTILIITAAAAIGYVSHKFAGMKEDNAVEELAEDVIEEKTGLDVDLSPDTPEDK